MYNILSNILRVSLTFQLKTFIKFVSGLLKTKIEQFLFLLKVDFNHFSFYIIL